jgi:predicted DsbA family dithiol-disulfide isomerase
VRDNPRAPYRRGPANARVVVIEHFSDYQCPFCSRVGRIARADSQRYGNRVRFVGATTRCPSTTTRCPPPRPPARCSRSAATRASGASTTLLFENQQNLDRADLERYARSLGPRHGPLPRGPRRHTHQAAIRDDMAAADATGAQIGTPAFFINGKFVAGALPFEEFQRRIDAALAAPAR